MSRLRDNEADFEGAVVSAAERLGLAPLFVEKDYWVTQVLRALHEQHAGGWSSRKSNAGTLRTPPLRLTATRHSTEPRP